MFVVRLPEEIEARLDVLAKRTGRRKTHHARAAIVRYMEDLDELKLAEQCMRRLSEGREPVVPLSVVMKRYGMQP